MKLYFEQPDVDAFNRRRFDLDDLVKKGDLTFAHEVFNVFLKRVDERVAMVDELLNTQHDFTVDEEMVTDPDVATYAHNSSEAREKWRKRIKYDLLMQKSDATKEKPYAEAEAKERLSRRYHSFSKRMHQTDNDELLEMFLTSVTTAYDPHTTYMSPGTLKNFDIMMSLELEGIGAELKPDDGYTVVNKVIKGGAADKDGRLHPEDKIVGVGEGENGELIDVVDMKLSDVVNKIRGKQGTTVRIEVIPVGTTDRKIYTIARARIELKDKEAQSKVFEVGKKPNGQPFRVGVIDLPSFYMDMEGARRGLPEFKSTTRDVRKILDRFRSEGVDAVMLDLRKNGGGSLTEAINLTGLFIDRGPVVQVKDSNGKVEPYDDDDRGMAWDGPLVVLISKFSASASEILAGAIQDYGRGLVVGDYSTHGKGTVQSLLDLGERLFFRGLVNPPQMGALKVTMQQFYRPNGESTQKRGVLADLELPSLTTHLPVGESDLDQAMEWNQVPRASFEKLNLFDANMLDQLRKASKARVAESADFKKVTSDIDRYNKQKEQKSVTLNEAKFLAERAELNADKEEEERLEKLESSDESIERDYYLDEALAITLDMVKALQSRHVANVN
jgi:carboxyl-terminal processing protease